MSAAGKDAVIEYFEDDRNIFDVLGLLHSGIAVFSKTGDFIYSNATFDKMFGLDDKAHLGRSVKDYFISAETGVMAVLEANNNASTASLSKNTMKHGFTHRFPLTNDNGEIIGCITETLYTGSNKKKIEELKEAIITLNEKANYYMWKSNSNDLVLNTFDHIIGTSPAIQMVKFIGARYALGSQPVLVAGESGTGKELIAQALHMAGDRSRQPFITVNCAALPPDLMESELFGYGQGAFSGARAKGMKGKFELADTGTIFLDEIGELPLSMQAKLLRVLESGEIQKLGYPKPVYVDFRLIAATNRDLKQMVLNGRFREDLFHRLNVLTLCVPSLRERQADIPILVQHLLERILGYPRARNLTPDKEVSDIFSSYAWPGNIRELKNVLTFASYAMEENERVLCKKHLPPHLAAPAPEPAQVSAQRDDPAGPRCTLSEASAAAERKVILDALQLAGNNKCRAAKQLGVSRKTLYKKLRDFGLL